MESSIKVRKVTQEVLMFIWYRHQIIEEEPTSELRLIPEITPELLENLRNVVWIQSFLNDVLFGGYFRKHLKRMTISVELFTKYVSFACYYYMKNSGEENIWFFDYISIVNYFVLRCYEKGYTKFLNISADLFCSFYKEELRLLFQGTDITEKWNWCLKEIIKKRNFRHLINANLHSFEQFDKLKDEFVQALEISSKPFSKSLEKHTEFEVEFSENVVNFVDTVHEDLEELYKKSLDIILCKFRLVDHLMAEEFGQNAAGSSGALSGEVEQSSLPKVSETTRNIPGKTLPEKMEQGKKVVTASGSSGNSKVKPPFFDRSLKPKLTISKPTKSERVRQLLNDISSDISKLFELIQSLCEEQEA